MLENDVFSCVPFCLRSLGCFERCAAFSDFVSSVTSCVEFEALLLAMFLARHDFFLFCCNSACVVRILGGLRTSRPRLNACKEGSKC